ncbi:FYN-binding protein 2 isoform X2 [Cynocephalus volans]|uniref:FYN-binding protein 2 isoform X2 n=1 Tax=Cynocephalus volans TaxID=110931 RepID=UPI002FC67851
MAGEGVRNFKELQAKFQKFDTPPLPGPTKFPAGVSQKDDIGSTHFTRILASGKPILSSHSQRPPYCSSGESHPLKPQKMKLEHRSEIQKCSDSPGPLKMSTVSSAVNSQKASLLLDVNQSDAEIIDKEKAMVANSFRVKLWNWEKVSSQKSEMSSALFPANYRRKVFHVEGEKVMGLTPEEPKKKLEAKGAQTVPSQGYLVAQRKLLATSADPSFLLSQHGRKSQENPGPGRGPSGSPCQSVYKCELAIQAPVAVKEGYLTPESAEFEEPHNYEATISYLRHSGNSINLCTAKEIADSTYEVEIKDFQKPWKNFLHQELSPKHADEDTNKEKEPCELEPQKTEKGPHSNHPFKVGAYEGTPGKIQMTNVHSRSMLAEKQDALIDVIQMKACPKGPGLARHSQSHDGYVKVLEVTKGTPDARALKPGSFSEETYDDVQCPRKEVPQLDLSDSLASDSEENSEKIYEDVYKTKSNYPKIDLDGKETLKRLQRFFKKEKDRFKMKKTKSKENVSAFSISLPDLELRSQEVVIYDDVDMSEKESKDKHKLKIRKPKFLILRETKEKKSAEDSESSSFFRTKMQNLEKNRMQREEKLFRKRFEYNKEIIVINTAVVCSNNSRNGIFDLPITPGEELEVIDTTEQNLVICRNSKGKYGYVLIEHLDFKHQGWSP